LFFPRLWFAPTPPSFIFCMVPFVLLFPDHSFFCSFFLLPYLDYFLLFFPPPFFFFCFRDFFFFLCFIFLFLMSSNGFVSFVSSLYLLVSVFIGQTSLPPSSIFPFLVVPSFFLVPFLPLRPSIHFPLHFVFFSPSSRPTFFPLLLAFPFWFFFAPSPPHVPFFS